MLLKRTNIVLCVVGVKLEPHQKLTLLYCCNEGHIVTERFFTKFNFGLLQNICLKIFVHFIVLNIDKQLLKAGLRVHHSAKIRK